MLVVALVMLGAGRCSPRSRRSIDVLIVGRVIQGCGGAIFPLAFGIIRDEFPRERVAQGIALISAILGIGGGLGIVLAGPIVDAFSYHWLFWFPLVLVVIATIATVFFVPESPVKVPGRVNWVGAVLLSAWLVCLLVGDQPGLDVGLGRPAHHRPVRSLPHVLLVVWVTVENRAAEPLVDMTMMRIRGVWTVNAAAFLVGAGMYSSFVLIPQFIETPESAGYGFASSRSPGRGCSCCPTTLGMLFVSPLAGRMTNRFGARLPLDPRIAGDGPGVRLPRRRARRPWEFYVGAALLGVGIGLAFASLANLIVAAVPPRADGRRDRHEHRDADVGGSVGSRSSRASSPAPSPARRCRPRRASRRRSPWPGGACLLAAFASIAVPRPVLAPVPVQPALASGRRDCGMRCAVSLCVALLAAALAGPCRAPPPCSPASRSRLPSRCGRDARSGACRTPPAAISSSSASGRARSPRCRSRRGACRSTSISGRRAAGASTRSTRAARPSRGGRRACRPTRRARAATCTGST